MSASACTSTIKVGGSDIRWITLYIKQAWDAWLDLLSPRYADHCQHCPCRLQCATWHALQLSLELCEFEVYHKRRKKPKKRRKMDLLILVGICTYFKTTEELQEDPEREVDLKAEKLKKKYKKNNWKMPEPKIFNIQMTKYTKYWHVWHKMKNCIILYDTKNLADSKKMDFEPRSNRLDASFQCA